MIEICEGYALKYKIMYNPKKSKLMCYNVNSSPEVSLSGSLVEVVIEEVYLGNHISINIYDRDIYSVVGSLYRMGNQIRADFACIDSFTHYKLFTTYCTNLYGSELWNYNKEYIEIVYTAWRILMRH